MTLPNLGLNDDDEKRLIDEVNCVFHCAATVRFDEHIKSAVNTNVRAVKDILKLAKQMNNLKVSFLAPIFSSFYYITQN